MDFLIEVGKLAPSLLYAIVLIWWMSKTRAEDRTEREARNKQIIEERAMRDKEWQDFLKQESAGTLRALDAVAISLSEVTKQLQIVNSRTERIESILENHDRHAEDVAKKQAEIVATMKTATKPRTTKQP